jgi:hypothetical protein
MEYHLVHPQFVLLKVNVLILKVVIAQQVTLANIAIIFNAIMLIITTLQFVQIMAHVFLQMFVLVMKDLLEAFVKTIF